MKSLRSSLTMTTMLLSDVGGNNGGVGGVGSGSGSSRSSSDDRRTTTSCTTSSTTSSSTLSSLPSSLAVLVPTDVSNTVVVTICLYVLIHIYYVRFLPTSSSTSTSPATAPRNKSSRRRRSTTRRKGSPLSLSSSSSKFLLPRGGGGCGEGRPRSRRRRRAEERHDDDDGMTASTTGVIDDDSDDNGSDDNDESEYSWIDDKKEEEIEIQVPDSTMMERRRFLIARKGDVDRTVANLQSYLDWRNEHHMLTKTTATATDDNTETSRTNTDINNKGYFVHPTHDRDYDRWAEACLLAMEAADEKVKNIVLPRVIRSYGRKQQQQQKDEDAQQDRRKQHQPSKYQGVVDHNGLRILHIIPGLMDDRLAKTSTYALATAIFIEKLFDRNDDEKVTVCLDVRAGKGWRNLHVLKLVPFIKDSLRLLLQLFPERLHKCVVYPIPPAFYYLWTMIAKCIDPKTRDKIVILTGKCTIDAPPPAEQLAAQLGEDTASQLEDYRVSCFRA